MKPLGQEPGLRDRRFEVGFDIKSLKPAVWDLPPICRFFLFNKTNGILWEKEIRDFFFPREIKRL